MEAWNLEAYGQKGVQNSSGGVPSNVIPVGQVRTPLMQSACSSHPRRTPPLPPPTPPPSHAPVGGLDDLEHAEHAEPHVSKTRKREGRGGVVLLQRSEPVLH